MKPLLYSLTFLLTVLFYVLEISFKSFSRISLAGFLHDLPSERIKRFDFVQKYELVTNSLGAFSSFLRLGLYMFSFFILQATMSNPIYAALVLIVLFLVLFNFLLYSISYYNKEKILKRLIFLYRIPWIFFYPLNIIFNLMHTNNTRDKEVEQDDPTDKELEIFFEESTKEGVLENEDKEMIESVIEFGDTLVKEIMTPRVDMIYINVDTTLEKLIETINAKKKSRYPVISNRIDNIIGLILSKDVFNQLNNPNFKISNILRKPFFVPETMRISELLKELQKSRKKFAIVVDEFGGVSGVVTMEDIIEEIVGEIQDEYDEDVAQIVKEKDHYVVRGDTDIHDINDTLSINIEDKEDYQTIAGLISFKLGKIPDKSDKISIDNYTFEVTDVRRNRIREVRIYREKE